MRIRDAAAADAEAMAAIINPEIRQTTASWGDAERTVEGQAAWIAERQAQGYPVLVAEAGQSLLGYGGLGPFRAGAGYRLTAEHSLYVARGARGLGVGARLLAALEARGRQMGLHALVGGIGSENSGSLAFHRANGFAEAGRLPGVGRKFDRWLDLVLMLKHLD